MRDALALPLVLPEVTMNIIPIEGVSFDDNVTLVWTRLSSMPACHCTASEH